MTFDGRWEAAITVPASTTIAATNSGGGPTTVTVPAATYSGPTTLLAAVVAALNATRTPANWTGSVSVGASGTGQSTLNYTGTGTYSITWTSTELRDLLGFAANLVAVTQGVASVGAKQARGLWIPDCPINLKHDPRAAPPRSDRRSVITPTGVVYTHVGNKMYVHRAVAYSHVPKQRIWEANATLANASLETFWLEAQLGFGSTWIKAGAVCQVYDTNGVLVGINGNAGAGLAGWQVATPKELDEMLTLPIPTWTGLYAVAIGDIASSG